MGLGFWCRECVLQTATGNWDTRRVRRSREKIGAFKKHPRACFELVMVRVVMVVMVMVMVIVMVMAMVEKTCFQ